MNEIEVKNKFKEYFLTCLYKNGFRYIVKHREGLIEAFKICQNMDGRDGYLMMDLMKELFFLCLMICLKIGQRES